MYWLCKYSLQIGGGPAPKELSPVTNAVMDIIGRNAPTVIGIEGGIDASFIHLTNEWVSVDQLI